MATGDACLSGTSVADQGPHDLRVAEEHGVLRTPVV